MINIDQLLKQKGGEASTQATAVSEEAVDRELDEILEKEDQKDSPKQHLTLEEVLAKAPNEESDDDVTDDVTEDEIEEEHTEEAVKEEAKPTKEKAKKEPKPKKVKAPKPPKEKTPINTATSIIATLDAKDISATDAVGIVEELKGIPYKVLHRNVLNELYTRTLHGEETPTEIINGFENFLLAIFASTIHSVEYLGGKFMTREIKESILEVKLKHLKGMYVHQNTHTRTTYQKRHDFVAIKGTLDEEGNFVPNEDQ